MQLLSLGMMKPKSVRANNFLKRQTRNYILRLKKTNNKERWKYRIKTQKSKESTDVRGSSIIFSYSIKKQLSNIWRELKNYNK